MPELDHIDAEALRDFWRVYEDRFDEINEESRSSFVDDPEFGPILKSMNEEQAAQENRRSLALLGRAIVDDDWDEYTTYLREMGVMYASMGITFAGWFRLMSIVRPFILRHLFDAFQGDARLQAVISAMDGFFDIVLRIIGEEYITTKETTIHMHQDAIRELSTPVLEISEGLLLLPIVGVIDSHRARQMTEQLLNAIRDHRARVVVIDITGVPAVDTMVANHLVQTTEAARLLGATSVVTGLSAEVAQTMVKLGVDLGGLNTVGPLRGGVVEANRILGS
jgi:rsbT co-antagonist protein RsbR